jgi:hypothetical protein
MEKLTFHLHKCKTILQNFCGNEKKKFTFIMGNEAMDLDSHVCSISLSFLLQYLCVKREEKRREKSGGDVREEEEEEEHLYVPLMNIERADFPLRGECVVLFSDVHLDVKDLIFLGLFFY